MSQPWLTNSPASVEDDTDVEFTEDVLKGYDRREVDAMAVKYCDRMIEEEPEDAEFWTWLRRRIRGVQE